MVVATLPSGSTPAGITEVEDDVFYVANVKGNATTITTYPNTTTLWKVDMRSYENSGKATYSKVFDIPEAGFLNGAVTLSKKDGRVLFSDSTLGLIFEVNVFNPSYKVYLDHPLFKPNETAKVSVGVNGLRIKNSKLYWVNTNFGHLGTFDLSAEGIPSTTPQLITSSVVAGDDFDIDSQGNIWLARNILQTFVRVSPAGQIDVIAGGRNSTALLGPVSARFGRNAWDKDTIYISTDGLSLDAKGKPLTNAGKIAKIDTKAWSNWRL